MFHCKTLCIFNEIIDLYQLHQKLFGKRQQFGGLGLPLLS